MAKFKLYQIDVHYPRNQTLTLYRVCNSKLRALQYVNELKLTGTFKRIHITVLGGLYRPVGKELFLKVKWC